MSTTAPTTADVTTGGTITLEMTVTEATGMESGYVMLTCPGGRSMSIYCYSQHWTGNTCTNTANVGTSDSMGFTLAGTASICPQLTRATP